MKFSQTYRVRWHDTDANRILRPSALFTLMQETANLQFEAAGLSLDRELRDRLGIGFLLSRMAVDVQQPVFAFEELTVETFTCPAKAFCFPRGFIVKRAQETVAVGQSQWALVRISDRRPLRSSEMPYGFQDEPDLPETQMPLRFCVPREAVFETVGKRKIGYADLDYNRHMNNTRYPDLLADFLPDPLSRRITGISLSYEREAPFGAELMMLRASLPDGAYAFRAEREGTVCFHAAVTTAKI